MSDGEPRWSGNSELLGELAELVADQPRLRLHVHPDAAMWISIGVANVGLSSHVQVVVDPDSPDVGLGCIEQLTVRQWRDLRDLVGRRVTVRTERLGALTGRLLSLEHGEARLDLGDGDIRYLPWITVQAAGEDS